MIDGIGRLRERLVVQQVALTADAMGGRTEAWTTLASVSAELVPIRTSERLQASAVQAQTDYRFRVRARADVTPLMRVLWTPTWPAATPRKTLQIHGVIPEGDGREYQWLECGVLQ